MALISPYRLKPFTSYKFRVKATNDIGDSEFSEESESLTTLQAGQYPFPSSLSVSPLATSRARDILFWGEVASKDERGVGSTGPFCSRGRVLGRLGPETPLPRAQAPRPSLACGAFLPRVPQAASERDGSSQQQQKRPVAPRGRVERALGPLGLGRVSSQPLPPSPLYQPFVLQQSGQQAWRAIQAGPAPSPVLAESGPNGFLGALKLWPPEPTCLLLSTAPDEAPTILSVTPHTTTSVLIRWQVRPSRQEAP